MSDVTVAGVPVSPAGSFGVVRGHWIECYRSGCGERGVVSFYDVPTDEGECYVFLCPEHAGTWIAHLLLHGGHYAIPDEEGE